jgi:hypothetical protein
MKARTALGTLLLLDLLLLGLILAPTSVANAPAEEDLVDEATGLPEGVSADWWAGAQAYIRRSEYDITWSERTVLADVPGAYQAPNRAQGLRTYFTPDGIRVVPRTEESPSWQLGLVLAGYGSADGGMLPLVEASLQAEGNSIAYQRGAISERYVNDEDGLEHQIVLSREASGVTLDLTVEGDLAPTLGGDGTVVEFTTTAGVVVLRYGDLHAIGASGAEVPVQLELLPENEGLRLTLPAFTQELTFTARLTAPDSAAASGGGLIPSARWWAESDQGEGSNQLSALLGHTAGTAGDVNGDGYADVIVGAHKYDIDSGEQGAAFVWYGSADGLGAGGRPDNADWQAYGENTYDWFGYAVGTAGDVNGDGYADVVVGARRYPNDTYEGAAYVWYGSDDGLCEGGPGPCVHDWKVESKEPGTDFGNAVGTAGDVNGDGYDEVIVAAYRYESEGSQEDEGAVFLWYGSGGGLQEPGAELDIDDDDWADWRAESNQGGAELGGSESADYRPMAGTAIATAGDVNGDGCDDVIVGAWLYDEVYTDGGAVFVWFGDGDGLNEGQAGSPINADWEAYGEHPDEWFGYAVGTAGDVNGDGFSDIIVGARYYNNGTQYEGGAFVWYGSDAGLGDGDSPDWQVESNQWGTDLGNAVGTAGDVNGDGYADIVVGAAWDDNGQGDEGSVFVWHGSAHGLCDDSSPCATNLDSADWWAESDQDQAHLGYAVGTAGDVNGDGYSDLIAGAPWYDNDETDEGGVFVWYGSGQGLSGPANWTADSDQSGAQMGYAVDSAGDINDDGYADVIVGAPYYDNGQSNEGQAYVFRGSASGLVTPTVFWMAEIDQSNAQFGSAVAGAGDVNGDGYADVLIGAPGYSDGENQEGAAFLWLGSDTGLGSNGDPDNAAWSVQGGQGGAYFGAAVAGAGDVNGDGYADILVGADGYDHGQADEGGVFLWEGSGSATGLCDDDSPCNCVGDVFCETDIDSADWDVEGGQEGAKFGHAVATAGDVNGDGLSDVLVGAPAYDGNAVDEGRAFLYLGSGTGLGSTPDWIAEGKQQGAEFAYAVGTAGDVNGDGYSDVVIGAPFFGNGPAYHDWQEGGVFLWLGSGSATGLPCDDPPPDLCETDLNSAGWHAEGDRYNAQLGSAVGTAGDVNGDGYADVIVGAPYFNNGPSDEGRALLYEGSAAGLSATPRWMAEGNQSGLFGLAVAGAGDVDGNGFADVIVGAPQYNTGVALENAGRVSLYYGNGGDNQALTPRQMQVDGLAPIAPLGLSDSENAVGLRLTGRTPLGRGEVKLQWQVAPLGTPFTATGIISGSSPEWNDTGDPTVENGVDITQTVTSLDEGTLYHWRVRLLYRPGNVLGLPASRWVHMPWNGWLETDFRTGGCAPPSSPAFEWTPSAPRVGQAVTFSGRCYGTPPLAYSWAFGDGHGGDGATVMHSYVVSGTYNVTMTVTGQCGAPAELPRSISVSPEDWWAYLPLVMR